MHQEKKINYFNRVIYYTNKLDGKKSNLEQSDLERRNTIATLLSDWGLVEIQNAEQVKECSSLKQIKIIPFKEKNEWELCPKYNIGNTK